jgi:hypothetical protein
MAARKNNGAKYEFSNLTNDELRDKIEELAGTIVEGSKKELDAETRKANGVIRRKITNARIQLFDRIHREADEQASAILDRQEWADAAARNEAWHELRLHLATQIGDADRAAWEASRGIATETETVEEIVEEAGDYTIATADGTVIAEVSHIDATEPKTFEEPTLGEIATANAAAGKHSRKRKTFDVELTKKGDYIIHPAGKRRQLTRVPDYRDVETFLEGYCGETHWPNIRHIPQVA